MKKFVIYVTYSFLLFAGMPAAAVSSDPLTEAARGYRDYQIAAEKTGRNLPRSGGEINRALKRLSNYQPQALGSGWIAEGAVKAAEDPMFRTGVAKAVSEAGGADAFAAGLESNPFGVMKITGAGNGMRAAFNNIKRQDQYFDWLSASLANLARGQQTAIAPTINDIVIPRAKPGARTVAAKTPDQNILKAPVHSMGQKQNLSVAGRIMVLAALDIAGRTESKRGISRVRELMTSTPMTGCLSLARQNLGQCLAASRGKAEKQFCAGMHAVGEVSKCFDWILPAGY